ncbi:hypothetical protein NHX12_019022 [Muraenolepis orangiensis]|uniref:Uncharacterized protein n=1 Tax=Muraenolepis orangiensis TaxID=630683 RepID=A0A9Q0ESJ6_9TELE|nr:hypothetical protein NHX12_019022 [Muraenolepis orangiensis]
MSACSSNPGSTARGRSPITSHNDQLKRDQSRKGGGRPQSAHSVSQGSGRESRSSKESRGSLQGENSPFLCSVRSSIFSNPRNSTSFHAKQVVYPLHGSRGVSRHLDDTASEFSFRRSETNLYGQRSAQSPSALGTNHQSPYMAFKDPVQKTYSGDLLHNHSHYFTRGRPFTPRTLRSDKSSSLSTYKYYMAPKRNPNPDPKINSRLTPPQTHGRRRELKQHSPLDYNDPPQGFSSDEEESIDPHVSLSTNQRHASRSSRQGSLSRASPEGRTSLSRMSAFAEVLDRVFERHIDKNRRRLDEGKMRHLLEVLRKDLDTGNTPTCGTAEKDPLYKHQGPVTSRPPHTPQVEERDLFTPYALLSTNGDSPTSAPSIPLHGSSSEQADSAIDDTKWNLEEFQPVEVTGDWLNDNGNRCTGIDNDGDLHAEQETGATDTADLPQEQHPRETSPASPGGGEALNLEPLEEGHDGVMDSKELEDLGRSLSESLHVTRSSTQGSLNEGHRDTCSSDDEF